MLGVAIGENTDFRKMLSFTMVLKFVEMMMKMNKMLVGCYFLYLKIATRTLVKTKLVFDNSEYLNKGQLYHRLLECRCLSHLWRSCVNHFKDYRSQFPLTVDKV